MDRDEFEVVDSTGLTDADWLEINHLKKVHKQGGERALDEALSVLIKSDPVRATRVMAAFFPSEMLEAIKDNMAANGLTVDDIREMILKLESGSRHTH
jgi:hypothetical protein